MEIEKLKKGTLVLREQLGEIESEGLKICMTIPYTSLYFEFEDKTQYVVPVTSIAADVIEKHKEEE